MIKKILLLGLVFSLSACSTAQKTTSGSSSASKSSSGDYSALFDSVMKQERTWAGLKTKMIKVRGLNIAYSEGGPIGAETIVMLHGFSADRNNWNRMAKYLTTKYRVLIPDLPGHGDSSSTMEQDYSMPELSSVMKGFVDTLGLEKYHIIGNSLGGGLAIQWSVFRPQQVLSLGLVNSAGLYEHEGKFMKDMMAGQADLYVRKPGDLRRMVNFAMYDRPFLPQELLEVMEQRQIKRFPVYNKLMSGMLETQKKMGPGMFSIALKSLRMPVFILWGDKDQIFEVQVTKELERNLKTSKTVVLKNVGHIPNFEAPKESAMEYLKFLAEY